MLTFAKKYWTYALFLVLFPVYSYLGYQAAYGRGETAAADAIFRYCHDVGGMLRNSETGETIGCGAVLSKNNKKELDTGTEVWYNINM